MVVRNPRHCFIVVLPVLGENICATTCFTILLRCPAIKNGFWSGFCARWDWWIWNRQMVQEPPCTWKSPHPSFTVDELKHFWTDLMGVLCGVIVWECTTFALRYHYLLFQSCYQITKPITVADKVKCPTCGKLYASKKSLKIHVRIHTGYKPYL